jgi:tRNA(Arg) A34 adenosine deaminase TadA
LRIDSVNPCALCPAASGHFGLPVTVYFAKRLRKSIFGAQAESVENIVINGVYISEFYPDVKHSQKRMLLEAAERAWESQMLGCNGCVNHCLYDGYGKTEMFDRLKKTGWPT